MKSIWSHKYFFCYFLVSYSFVSFPADLFENLFRFFLFEKYSSRDFVVIGVILEQKCDITEVSDQVYCGVELQYCSLHSYLLPYLNELPVKDSCI